MARRCTICSHPQRAAIDAALLSDSGSVRRLVAEYDVSERSLYRHKADHLAQAAARAVEAIEAVSQQVIVAATAAAVQRDLDILGELHKSLSRANKLFDACDAWLTDPENSAVYSLEPRAAEVDVIYLVRDDEGKLKRRKRSLAELLQRLEDEASNDVYAVVGWETKYADPRELILKTHARLEGTLTLFAKLIGELADGGELKLSGHITHGHVDLSGFDVDELRHLRQLAAKAQGGR